MTTFHSGGTVLPAEITHKSAFSPGKFLGWLAAMWVFGYVVGINHGASADEPPTIPEPSQTVHVTPGG